LNWQPNTWFRTLGVAIARSSLTTSSSAQRGEPVLSRRRVPAAIAADFSEAAVVLPDSAKASAALSRRCLQSIIRDPNAGGVTDKNLNREIEQVIQAGNLPTYALKELHYVREVGNAAAHPMQSGATGQVYDVKPNEAESLLDVLETLFDEYYVKPAASAARLASWKQNRP